MAARPLFAVIPTHTPRYLDIVLVGLGRQTRRPDAAVVTCDTDDAAIGDVIERWAPRLGFEVHWVRRAHHGVERLCQVRNNGVRHIVEGIGATAGRIVILDGDMFAADVCLALHERFGASADLVYPYRCDVPRELSEGLDADRILSGAQQLSPTAEQFAALEQRHRRYQRQLLLRRLRLGPLHKPKLLGGHFSCSIERYVELNGFDELYQGWGFKDDEFARRAAKIGATCRVAVREIVAFHLWHETRQPPGRMADLPQSQRFARRDLPVIAGHGVRSPLPQNEVRVTRFR